MTAHIFTAGCSAFLCWFLGVTAVYAALFGIGFLLYGRVATGVVALILFALVVRSLFRLLPRVGFSS